MMEIVKGTLTLILYSVYMEQIMTFNFAQYRCSMQITSLDQGFLRRINGTK